MMKDLPLSVAFLALIFFFPNMPILNAATLSLDLDIQTPGIQRSRTLNVGDEYMFGVVYTGDGNSQFDTFGFDVVCSSSAVGMDNPVAGPGMDSAPMIAFDIYGSNEVNSGDLLTQGSMPTPLGFAHGLGGVGVASLGGMPFPLLVEDESIGLFSASLTALHGGIATLALTGYPFGVGAELSLEGARVPVSLQGATITVVPLPPVLWLFVSGVLALLGMGYRAGRTGCKSKYKTALSLSLFCALATISLRGFAVPQDSDADLDGDLIVTAQDISILASCFGKDPASTSACEKADVDEDGDIDGDDFSFVSARLGQAYTETLFQEQPIPPSFPVGDSPGSIALNDVNGDGINDVMTANSRSSDISVLLGNGDGYFQAEQRVDVGSNPQSIVLDDVNGDGRLDVVTANKGSNDISVLLGNGDGGFQAQQRFDVVENPESIALGDFDGNGILDVVTLGSTYYFPNRADVALNSIEISVLLGNGDGSFQVEQRFPVGSTGGVIDMYDFYYLINFIRSIALGDVNGDGVLDVLTANLWGNNMSVLLGNGDGSFQAQRRFSTGDHPRSITLRDVNSDGALDAVMAVEYEMISVLLGNGDGSFNDDQHFNVGGITRSMTLNDVNDDGVLDIASANLWNSDVTVLLGNGNGSFQVPLRFAPGSGPSSIALSDINGDGVLDGVTTNRGSDDISVLIGNGDGSFQALQRLAEVNSPGSMTLSDLNGDGWLDVVAAGSVLLGNGSGGFQQHIEVVGSLVPFVLGDINSDGVLDMVSGNAGGEVISVLLGIGDGSFQAHQIFDIDAYPISLALGDLNGDGWLDVVTGNVNSGDFSVLFGNSDGGFQFQYRSYYNFYPAKSIELGDMNGDGVLDLVATIRNDILVMLGNGDGSFQARQFFAVGRDPSSLALSDLNNDGRLDVVTFNSSDEDISVLLGNGDGSFQVQQRLAVVGPPVLRDVNGDGVIDIVAADTEESDILVCLGNGDGSFQAQQRFAVNGSPEPFALGDINNDGKLDVVGASGSYIGSYISILLFGKSE
jgi:hypothetical protein